LSDLYISHPGTTANFTACAGGVPAIFFNFTPLDFLDEFGKKFYGIKNIAKNMEDFQSLLRQFKEGKLLPQYSPYDVDMKAVEKTVSFIVS